MTCSSADSESEYTTLTREQREVIEDISKWDEEKYPIAKHAQQILENIE